MLKKTEKTRQDETKETILVPNMILTIPNLTMVIPKSILTITNLIITVFIDNYLPLILLILVFSKPTAMAPHLQTVTRSALCK